MKSRYFTSDEKQLMINMYNSGKNTVEISKLTNRGQSGIERFLKREGYSNFGIKSSLSEEDKVKIIEMYESGATCVEIWKSSFESRYKSSAVIERFIRESGLSRGRYAKEAILNHDYFECIDSEKKAYILGFIMADGCVMNVNGMNKKKITLALNSGDREVIDMFAKDVESNKKPKTYKRSYDNKEREIVMLDLFSPKMFSDLAKYGVVPNKTNIDIPLPTNIKDEFMNHYIRGYFDGDGSVGAYKPKDQNKLRLRVSICTTKTFGSDLIKLLNEQDVIRKVYKSNLIDMNKYGISIYHVRMTSMTDIEAFYNYIYKDSTVFLKRKREIFESVLFNK